MHVPNFYGGSYQSPSGFPFLRQSQLYLDFIFSYYNARNIYISAETIKQLWGCYITRGLCIPQKDLLFNKLKECLLAKNSGINNRTAKQFFEELFCNFLSQYTNPLTYPAFQCFTAFFEKYNSTAYEIASPEKQRLLQILPPKTAIFALLKLIFASSQADFEEEAIQYLIEAFIANTIRQKGPSARQQLLPLAIDMILTLMVDDSVPSKRLSYLNTGIKIINKLIEEIEYQRIEEIDNSYFAGNLLEFKIHFKSPLRTGTFQIDERLRVLHLKKIISHTIKVDARLIQLKSYSSTIQGSTALALQKADNEIKRDLEYVMYVHKSCLGNLTCIVLCSDVPASETPSAILAKPALFERLKKFLDLPQEETVLAAWKLITKLPIGSKILTKLQEGIEKNEGNWEKVLDMNITSSSITILAYHAYLLAKQVSALVTLENNTKVAKEERGRATRLIEYFLKKDGSEFLCLLLERRGKPIILSPSAGAHSLMGIKCLDYLLQSVALFAVPSHYDALFVNPARESFIWESVLEIMNFISESKESNKNIQSAFVELFKSCSLLQQKMIICKPALIGSMLKNPKGETQGLYGLEIMQKVLLSSMDSEELALSGFNHLKQIFSPLEKREVGRAESPLNGALKEILTSAAQQYSLAAIVSNSDLKHIYEAAGQLLYLCNDSECEKLLLESKSSIVEKLVDGIITRIAKKQNATNGASPDFALIGLMELLYIFVAKSPGAVVKLIASGSLLVQSLLTSLFHFNQKNLPICQHQSNREYAQKLLEALILHMPQAQNEFFKFLTALHLKGNWRTAKKGDWSISGVSSNENPQPFMGLKNLGATCYMNSLMQQLFMNEYFRSQLLMMQSAGVAEPNNKSAGRVLKELQILFTALRDSQRPFYNPKSFALSMSPNESSHRFDLTEQKDVDEYALTLFDKLESEVKTGIPATSANFLKNTYSFTLAHEILCRDAPHRSETIEVATSLMLNVKNRKSIYESLQSYVEAESLEGDNAYSCEQCGQKVPAEKRQNIKLLPNSLIIVLKRFEFNIENNSKVKLNDYCEFPMDLNMKAYTQEGIMKRELMTCIEKGKISQEELSEEQKRILKREVYEPYYTYRLKGVIIHSGHADGGHYYSFIQDGKTNNWYEFNDMRVRLFDIKNLPEEAFGGEDTSLALGKGSHQKEMRTRTRNAYMLFYERKEKYNMDMIERLREEESKEKSWSLEELQERYKKCLLLEANQSGVLAETGSETAGKIIQMDNEKYWLTKFLFDSHYLNMVHKILNAALLQEDSMKSYVEARELLSKGGGISNTIKFSIVFFLTTSLRESNKENTAKLVLRLKELCKKNILVALYFLELFSSVDSAGKHSLLQEFFITNPSTESKAWIAGILSICLNFVYQYEKDTTPALLSKPQKEYLYNIEEIKKIILSKGSLSEADLKLHKNTINCSVFPKSLSISFIFINSIIQQLPLMNAHNLGRLYQILASFARLSNDAVLLLAHSSVFGMSLEQLLFDSGASWEKIQEKIVHIKVRSPNDLELLTIQDVQPKAKKKKEALMKDGSSYIFVLEVIHQMLHGFSRVKVKPTDPSYTPLLSSTESSYIASLSTNKDTTPKALEKILDKIETSKAAVTFFAKIISQLAFANKEATEIILAYLINSMKESECNRIKNYFRITTILLLNGDTFFISKADIIYNSIFSCFEASKKVYRIAECLMDYFIKLCRKSKQFYEHLSKTKETDKSKISEMDKWINRNPYPACDFQDSIFKKRKELRMTDALVTTYRKDYAQINRGRLSNLQTILKGAGSLSPDYDSDDDMYTAEVKLQEGHPYDIYIEQNSAWVPAKAVSVTDEMALFEFILGEERHRMWLPIESDKIAPKGSMSDDTRRRINAMIDRNLLLK